MRHKSSMKNIPENDHKFNSLGGGRELRVGDHLSINDNDAVVVGSYHARDSFFWEPVMYTTYRRALQWAPRERNLLSFVLVKVKAGADLDQVRRGIERKTGLKALTNQEFVYLTADYILNATGILINFGMAVVLGFIIGLIPTMPVFSTLPIVWRT